VLNKGRWAKLSALMWALGALRRQGAYLTGDKDRKVVRIVAAERRGRPRLQRIVDG
jgi:hypothetical protein